MQRIPNLHTWFVVCEGMRHHPFLHHFSGLLLLDNAGVGKVFEKVGDMSLLMLEKEFQTTNSSESFPEPHRCGVGASLCTSVTLYLS